MEAYGMTRAIVAEFPLQSDRNPVVWYVNRTNLRAVLKEYRLVLDTAPSIRMNKLRTLKVDFRAVKRRDDGFSEGASHRA